MIRAIVNGVMGYCGIWSLVGVVREEVGAEEMWGEERVDVMLVGEEEGEVGEVDEGEIGEVGLVKPGEWGEEHELMIILMPWTCLGTIKGRIWIS